VIISGNAVVYKRCFCTGGLNYLFLKCPPGTIKVASCPPKEPALNEQCCAQYKNTQTDVNSQVNEKKPANDQNRNDDKTQPNKHTQTSRKKKPYVKIITNGRSVRILQLFDG